MMALAQVFCPDCGKDRVSNVDVLSNNIMNQKQ